MTLQGILVVCLSSFTVLYSYRPIPTSAPQDGRLLATLTSPIMTSAPSFLTGHIQTDRIFIGNLPFTVTEAIVREIVAFNFGDGKIRDIKIAAGLKTKRPLGFLFADFFDAATAAAAVNLFDGYDLEGRILNSNLKFIEDTKLIKAATQSDEKVKLAPLSSLKSSNTIYLSNLDYSLDEEEIYNMCDDLVGVGLVHEVRIPLDIETGSSRGFAYIEFKDSASVTIAMKELSEVEVYGRILKVERMAMPRRKAVQTPVIVKEVEVRIMHEMIEVPRLTLEQEEDAIFASLSY